MDGVSNPWVVAEPSCLGTGTEIGVPDDLYASVANRVVGARSTGVALSGENLKCTKLF